MECCFINSSANSSGGDGHKTLIRSAAEVVLGRGTVALIGIAFLAYFARELPAAVLGLIAVHTAIVAAAKVIIDLGLHFHVVRDATPLFDANKKLEAINDVIAPSTLIRLLATVILTLVLLLLGYSFVDAIQAGAPQVDIALALPFACAHLFLKACLRIMTPIFHAQQKFWIDAVLDSGSAAMEKIFAVLLYLFFGSDFIFCGFAVGVLVTMISAMWLLRDVLVHIRPHHLAFEDSWRRLRTNFASYQRVLYRRGLRQVDRLTIAALVPLADMALYHVARSVSNVIRDLAHVMAGPLSVRLAAGLGTRHEQYDRRVFYSIMIGVGLLTAGLSPWLTVLVGGEGYAEAWIIMATLCVSLIFSGLSEYQLTALVILGAKYEKVLWEAFSGLVGIGATILGISLLGVYGAPAGHLLSFVLLYIGGRLAIKQFAKTRNVMKGM